VRRRNSKDRRDNKRNGEGSWRDAKRRKIGPEDRTAGVAFTQEEIEAEQKRPKRKVAVMVGYSGTGYKGMQVNGDDPTIERDLFRAFVAAGAISKANADDPRKSSLVRCARTDKGVHAAGNVISLKLIIEDENIVDKINEALPAQIRVWGIQRTNNSFSCYQGCDSRWYEYLLPSYSLLPPHPQTYLGKMIQEYAKKFDGETELNEKMADVKDFWTDVEEKDIKPVLDSLDPSLRVKVLERIHSEEVESATDTAQQADGPEPSSKPEEAAQAPDAQPSTDADQSASDSKPTEQADRAAEVPGSVQPRKRALNAMDFALRDIKHAYVAAKRRYRISPERLARLQEALDKYQGTKNFHNYTVQKSPTDPSAKRHIKSFVVNPKPIIIGDTEWLSLKVHGQSFMMHQIRKMVGLASLLVRCGTPLDRINESYQHQKMAIPKAPGLGLLLERPVFANYNERAVGQLGKEAIDFTKYNERLEAFKQEHIYERIFEVEERDNV
jgi:tRNA pseudouridine38-40 synthase